MTVTQFITGLVLLVAGAELLVRSAAAMAQRVGLSPVVIGLTVVALGTSAPEMAISVQSALANKPEIALGNVVGSNIANVLLILGISATMAPLAVAQQIVRLDVPLMVGASLLTVLLAANGFLGRAEGALLFVLLIIYLVFTVRQSRRSSSAIVAEYDAEYGERALGRRDLLTRIVTFVIGLVIMVWGARWLVDSASAIAAGFGVSQLVIGLTVVAVGTSAPELATSVIATLRGERDIAVGNVVGSNILNLLAVLGLTAFMAPNPIAVPAKALVFDLPIMLAVAIACLPIFYTRFTIRRWEGLIFLAYYVAYTLFLYLSAASSPSLTWFRGAMLYFAVPLTVLGLVFSLIYEVRLRRREATTLSVEGG